VAEHAHLFSPSASKGWLKCAGRSVLEAAFPDAYNPASDGGTAEHLIARLVLTEDPEWPAAIRAIGTEVPVHSPGESARFVRFTQEMAERTQDYIDTMRAIARGKLFRVEHRVDFRAFLGVEDLEDEGFGTADFLVLSPMQSGGFELGIYDYKSGWIKVDPVNNSQGMLYALGALHEFEMSHDIRQVRIGIFQPKHGGLSEWVVPLEDLMVFAEYAKTRAAEVLRATTAHALIPDAQAQVAWEDIYLHPNPNEDDCRFCKATAVCPAMQAKVNETISAGFDDVKENPPLFQGEFQDDDAALAAKMDAAGMIEGWIKAVRAEVERRLLAGLVVPGWGLELGREGRREWSDPEAAEEMLRKKFRLTVEQSYDMQVISPTSAEKLLKTKNKSGRAMLLSKKQWEAMQENIIRSPASPSVKPASAIKTPYVPPGSLPPADDFETIEE
jgi:hypothetical protein